MRMRKVFLVSFALLSGCASMVPTDPLAAKQKLATDLKIELSSVLSVRPCLFAVTPTYVRRAEFTECAFVETEKVAYVARAIPKEDRFDKSVSLVYSSLTGFNLRNWGLGASQLQFITNSTVVSIHLKSGGKESMDQPEEAQKIAGLLRSKSVPEIESPGRVDQLIDSVIPVFIPVR